MAGPRDSLQNIPYIINIPQIITLPVQLALFPQCILVLSVPQVRDAHAPIHSHDVKEVIHKTRPLSSIAPWSSSAVHMPIVDTFGGGQGSAWVS